MVDEVSDPNPITHVRLSGRVTLSINTLVDLRELDRTNLPAIVNHIDEKLQEVVLAEAGKHLDVTKLDMRFQRAAELTTWGQRD